MTRRNISRGVLTFSLAITLALSACLPAGCRAEQPWPFWERYAEHFIDPQGRVVDHSAKDHTTSEGQAYAMFFALVAGDRGRFEKLLGWTEANLADGDLTGKLPAWEWGRNADGAWKVLDPNPAADADLWMAYSLMEAGRLWRLPRYEKLGTMMATRIAQQEVVLVPGLGTTLSPGPRGFHPDSGTWVLNPSYLPPPVLARFAQQMPQGPWASVTESLHMLLSRGSGAGFAMDWIAAGKGVHPSASPAELILGHESSPAVGSYDAIRVYLWLGIADQGTPGIREMEASVNGMADYLRRAVTPPLEVDAKGAILNASGTIGFSSAVMPFLQAGGMKEQMRVQMDRLTATKDAGTGLYGKNAEYYDQNLTLFATGWLERRYSFDREGKLKVKWK